MCKGGLSIVIVPASCVLSLKPASLQVCVQHSVAHGANLPALVAISLCCVLVLCIPDSTYSHCGNCENRHDPSLQVEEDHYAPGEGSLPGRAAHPPGAGRLQVLELLGRTPGEKQSFLFVRHTCVQHSWLSKRPLVLGRRDPVRFMLSSIVSCFGIFHIAVSFVPVDFRLSWFD